MPVADVVVAEARALLVRPEVVRAEVDVVLAEEDVVRPLVTLPDARAATLLRATVLADVADDDADVVRADVDADVPAQPVHSDHGPHGGHESPLLGAIETSAQFQNSSAAVVPTQSRNVVLKKPLPPSPLQLVHFVPKSKFL